ncbi:hypothetical protein [Actinophytocola oryzae]|uniref:Uncharacterized protein n=1 Tax=Actinophytocola oryzae TaxID=502181 RepID=A0A4R7UVQ1_9PSEU|nr:hypothetical protein [Actinophytocola oryzae]TDV40107.1 hypothetical protein CLV71_124126 [Actinophytocola oryzae]
MSEIADQLRARRAASYRLPPLACGHRDPLDCPQPQWTAAARAAWYHLNRLGLVDRDGFVTAILAGAA